MADQLDQRLCVVFLNVALDLNERAQVVDQVEIGGVLRSEPRVLLGQDRLELRTQSRARLASADVFDVVVAHSEAISASN